MFEKEAEEYVKEWIVEEDVNALMQEAFQDGAEFGYKKGQSDQLVHKQYQLNQLRKANEWHYVKDGKDLPLEAGLHIRVVLHNGNEYICETDYYEPSEDEIGFGHLLIQLYSNDEWIDDNDVYAWCEISQFKE